jgi:hypothetical protein
MADFTACVAHSVRTRAFSGDAQIARIACSNFGTLSDLYGAIQIHSERKPSRLRSDYDSIQSSLNSISLRSGLAWTSAARPLLTYAAAFNAWTSAARPLLTYLLT